MSDSPSLPPRRQQDRSAQTRMQLLDSAIEEINVGGAASLTTTRVAERAQVTRGALQHHFKSPNELYLAVIERGWQELVAAQDTLLNLQVAAGHSDADLASTVREWVRCMTSAYARPAVVAAFQLMLARQGDAQLIAQQQEQLSVSEHMLDQGWVRCFGGDPSCAHVRHLLRDAILGGLSRRVVAERPEDPEREEALVATGCALLKI